LYKRLAPDDFAFVCWARETPIHIRVPKANIGENVNAIRSTEGEQ
jgi:hypothetical protein